MQQFILIMSTIMAFIGSLYYYNNGSDQIKDQMSHTSTALDIVSDKVIFDSFQNWKYTQSKKYGNEENDERFKIYKQNYEIVQIHNQDFLNNKTTFKMGLNKFADMSNKEFKKQYMGMKSEQSNRSQEYVQLVDQDLPESIDWREKGVVTSVKNQGQCGSCWAFSTIGAIEGLYAIKHGKLLEFSQQQLVDCSQDYGNNGCEGGLMDNAFNYIKEQGITTQDKYPYKGVNQRCQYDKQSEDVYQVTGWVDVPQNSSQQLMAAVAKNPVSVAIDAEGMEFQSYHSGIYDQDCGTNLDHGVLIIGYGSENGIPYWIIRNSWGPDWGENGYIRMKRQINETGPGECGIRLAASYPTDILQSEGSELLMIN